MLVERQKRMPRFASIKADRDEHVSRVLRLVCALLLPRLHSQNNLNPLQIDKLPFTVQVELNKDIPAIPHLLLEQDNSFVA